MQRWRVRRGPGGPDGLAALGEQGEAAMPEVVEADGGRLMLWVAVVSKVNPDRRRYLCAQ
jgi:hypothetical protein